MAKKPKQHVIPEPMASGEDCAVSELAVLKLLGVSWSTWERDYRTHIPGWTTPGGRIYLKREVFDFIDFLSHKPKGTKVSQYRSRQDDSAMRAAGFLTESDVRAMWILSDEGFEVWLRKSNVPHVTIGEKRYFDECLLHEWFRAQAKGGKK